MRPHRTPHAIYRTYSPYPKSFFIIALMMWFWWLWGLDMQAHYYPQGDLLRGLAYFLLTAVLMISSPYIYHYALRHRFEKQAYYQEKLQQLQSQATAQEYAIVARYVRQHGHFPYDMPRLMTLAMLFLIVLFDLFFLSAWVDKNGAMVWQPEWAKSIVKWATERINTRQFPFWSLYDVPNMPSDAQNKLAMVKDFLHSQQGQTLILLHIWTAITYPVYLAGVCFIAWQTPPDDPNAEKPKPTIFQWILWRIARFLCFFFGLAALVIPTGVGFTLKKINYLTYFSDELWIVYVILPLAFIYVMKCLVGWFRCSVKLIRQCHAWLLG